MFHMKEIDKTPEEELREVEIGNLPRKVFCPRKLQEERKSKHKVNNKKEKRMAIFF